MKQLKNLEQELQSTEATNSTPETLHSLAGAREFLVTCWKRKWLFIVFVFIFVGCALYIVQRLEPRYTATAIVELTTAEKIPIGFEQFVEEIGKTPEDISSELETIASKKLASKVIARLNIEATLVQIQSQNLFSQIIPLQSLPEPIKQMFRTLPFAIERIFPPTPTQWLGNRDSAYAVREAAIKQFLSRLTVDHIKETRMIKISFTIEDRKLADLIVNTLIEFYQQQVIERKFETTHKASEWLNSQLSDLQKSVETAEATVEDLRRGEVLIQGRNSEIISQRVAQINSQLMEVNVKTSNLRGRLRQIKNLRNAPDWEKQNAAILNNPLVGALLLEQFKLEQQAADLSSTYGEKHPIRAKLKAELTSIDERLKQELQKEESALKEELSISQDREKTLEDELQELAYRVGDVNEGELRLRAAEREAEASRRIYEAFLSRHKESEIQQQFQRSNIHVISLAETPKNASFPRKGAILFGALVLAIIGSFCVIQGQNVFETGFGSASQVKGQLRKRVIAVIPKVKTGGLRGIKVENYIVEKPVCSYAEAITRLYSDLRYNSMRKSCNVVVLSSALSKEGKSTTAISLARRAALSGENCLLIDCDFRRPDIARKIGLNMKPGLKDFINGSCNLSELMQADKASPMKFVSPGCADVDGVSLICSPFFQKFIEHIMLNHSFIVIDTPPVLAVPDGKVLASMVGEVVFVVKWRSTPRETVMVALEQLEEFGVDIAGVVLSQLDTKRQGRYDYGEVGYYSKQLQDYYHETS